MSILFNNPAVLLHSLASVTPPSTRPPAAQANVPVLVKRVYSTIPSLRASVRSTQPGNAPGITANTETLAPLESGNVSQLIVPLREAPLQALKMPFSFLRCSSQWLVSASMSRNSPRFSTHSILLSKLVDVGVLVAELVTDVAAVVLAVVVAVVVAEVVKEVVSVVAVEVIDEVKVVDELVVSVDVRDEVLDTEAVVVTEDERDVVPELVPELVLEVVWVVVIVVVAVEIRDKVIEVVGDKVKVLEDDEVCVVVSELV